MAWSPPRGRRGFTPHVAQNTHNRARAIDGGTTRHPGRELSGLTPMRIEQAFGWIKTVAASRKTRHRGMPHVRWIRIFSLAAFNLMYACNLQEAVAHAEYRLGSKELGKAALQARSSSGSNAPGARFHASRRDTIVPTVPFKSLSSEPCSK